MKISEIKVKNIENKYSIFIGNNILSTLPKKINSLCPKTNKVAIIIDKKIPKKYKLKIKKILKRYKVFIFEYTANEKLKSFQNANRLAEKIIFNNFNRSDIIIGFGGGIIGDFTAFTASIVKRGINFINIPSTLLAQVDSSIGGKTGVNSKYGNWLSTCVTPKRIKNKNFKNNSTISIWFAEDDEKHPIKFWIKMKYGGLLLELYESK